MNSNENLDFNDEFDEMDDKQNEDDYNDGLSFGSGDDDNQQKQSDSEDNLYYDTKKDKKKKQTNRIIDDNQEEEEINNMMENEMEDEGDLMDLLNTNEDRQKTARENFLNTIKNAGDDDTIMKLIEERQQLGRTDAGEINPHIVKEQMILEKMLQKQKRYDEIMFEKEKLEFLKKTRKIRQNPEEYRNFIKCFVLCEVASTFYYLQSHLENPLLKAMILSQFSAKDLNFLQTMKDQPDKYSTKSIIKTVNYHIQQYFVYKWKKEQIEFMKNLETGVEVGYSQMTLIAIIIFEYIGLKVRFTQILDMRYLNLDKKHNSRIKENKRNSNQSQDSNSGNKRRSRESIVSGVIASKKPTRFSDMASRIAANIMTQQQEQSESEGSDNEDYDETSSSNKLNKQKENNDFFDSFMANFKFDKKNPPQSMNSSAQKKNQNDEDSLISTASSNIQNTDSNKFDFRKYVKKGQNDKAKTSVNAKNKDLEKEEEEIILVKSQFDKMKKIECKQDEEEDEQEETLNPFNFAYSKKKYKNSQKSLIQTQQSSSQDSCLLDAKQSENIEKQDQKSHKSDFYQSSEIKYWLEVYDEKNQSWICFDAVQNEILEKFQILLKQNGMPILFIVGYNKLDFKNENLSNYINEKRSMKNNFLFDITDIHCDRYPKIQISRKELNLDYWWKNLLQHVSFLGNPDLLKEEYKQQVINERNLKVSIQKAQLPQTFPEFRASEIYITKSMLQKYQGLHPNAVKTGLTFKDEDVYFREYVVELHAKTRWRILKRQVRPDEKPQKQVQSILGNNKMVDLFGEWQTDDLFYKIGDDGSLPRNEYGNWETFAADPPEGTVLIDLQGLPKLLKKNNIDFVEAVSGFESSSSGRSHVVKRGVLAHKKDEERIRQLYLDNYEIMKAQQAENLKKELMGFWRKIFKGVILKKSISDRINKINM